MIKKESVKARATHSNLQVSLVLKCCFVAGRKIRNKEHTGEKQPCAQKWPNRGC